MKTKTIIIIIGILALLPHNTKADKITELTFWLKIVECELKQKSKSKKTYQECITAGQKACTNEKDEEKKTCYKDIKKLCKKKCLTN